MWTRGCFQTFGKYFFFFLHFHALIYSYIASFGETVEPTKQYFKDQISRIYTGKKAGFKSSVVKRKLLKHTDNFYKKLPFQLAKYI